MKKTVTANVSGTVFHIEEDAYDRLQRYLGGIRAQFEGTDGREEIMADIEARIAELFRERLDGRRQVVTLEDVDHVVAVMGQPEDYADGEAGEARQTPPSDGAKKTGKRLFRDMDDKWVGGVIGGLAAYIGTDPLWLRIAMIVFFFLGSGTPFLIYVILWILVPAAETPADRLRMSGEPVNVDNLKRAFEEGGQRVAHEAKDLGRKWGAEAKRSASGASSAVARFIGAIIILGGLSLLVGLVTSVIGGAFGLLHASWSTGELGPLDLGALVIGSRSQALWLGIGTLVLCLVPIVAILLAGFRLLFDTRTPGWLAWSLALLWFSALVPVIVAALATAGQFQRKASVRDEIELTAPADGTLYLDAFPHGDTLGDWHVRYRNGRVDMDTDGIRFEDGQVAGGWARIDVQASPDSLYRLVVVRESRGPNGKEALARAQRIITRYEQAGDALFVSPVLRFPQADGIRAQDADFTLQVPVGGKVFFRPGSKHVIHDVENVTNTYDRDMIGKAWRMTPRGLEEDNPFALPLTPAAPEAPKPMPQERPSRTNRSEEPATREVRLPSVLAFLRLAI
jgi:phage shock protein PspC (stress-responsive transcriptional regulator)